MFEGEAMGLKDYIVVAILAIVTSLSGYFTTRHSTRFKALEAYNVDKEKEAKLDKEKAAEHCEKCKATIVLSIEKANKALVDTFKEGIKTERELQHGVLDELKENVISIFKALKEISVSSASLESTMSAHIVHQVKVCDMLHAEMEKRLEGVKERFDDLADRISELERNG